MEEKGRRWWRGVEQRVNVRGRNGDRAGERRKMVGIGGGDGT